MTDPTRAPDLSPVERAWSEVEADWQNPARHDGFLALCSALGTLAEAARHYRVAGERDGSRTEMCQKRIQQITFLAMRGLEATPPPAPQRKQRILTVIAALFLLMMLLYTYFALSRL